jgi:hypothetical protein
MVRVPPIARIPNAGCDKNHKIVVMTIKFLGAPSAASLIA